MKKSLLFTLFLIYGFHLLAQDVKIPTSYQLKAAEDYAPYKDSVVIAANWMISNPLDQHIITRQEANKFLFSWVSGAPYTHLEIRSEFTDFIMNDSKNPYGMDLLMIYLAGMVLVKIENDTIDDLVAQEAGIHAMLRGYESIRSEYKIKFLDKVLKAEKKGGLTKWVRDNAKTYGPEDKTTIIPN